MSQTYLIDTNILLRLALADDELQTRECIDLIRRSEEGEFKLVLNPIAVVEAIWVLEGRNVDRRKTDEILSGIVGRDCFVNPARDVALLALELYGKTSLEIADCFLISVSNETGVPVVSYDKGLRKALRTAVKPADLLKA